MIDIVRPNQWDSREARLEEILTSLLRRLQIYRPELFEGDGPLDTLDLRVSVRRAQVELKKPKHSDLEERVRSPLVRWWRERRG